MPSAEPLATTVALFVKATILAARWAATVRRRTMTSIVSMSADEKDKEIAFLRERVDQLQMQVQILRKGAGKKARSPRYTLSERLHVIWFVEYFQIPRRKVTEVCLSPARGTTHLTELTGIRHGGLS